jgi:predicted AAA+ superfamily ATPase
MQDRWFQAGLEDRFARPYVHLVFGARQTGKSTLVGRVLPDDALRFDLTLSSQRLRLAADPDELVRECRALPRSPSPRYVFIDEAQTVPAIFDAVQHLYDSDTKRWRFVLCGSSARKLRATGANLLPGRSMLHRLQPLVLAERPAAPSISQVVESPLPFTWPEGSAHEQPFPPVNLIDRLAWGDLPGVATAPAADRAELLRSYALVYMEEEIRREALVRDWAAFVRFVRLAAAESGGIVNYASISRASGLSQPTVKSYYQLLEDMFLGVRVTPWVKSPRKNVMASPRFLIFDLGVRHAAAGLEPSKATVLADPGPPFEQWVGLELHRRLQYIGRGELHYFRTHDGAEVDYVLAIDKRIVPIEVKWTDKPTPTDAKQVEALLDDHPKQAKQGYVVCRCPRPQQLTERVVALPWQLL